MTNKLDTCLPYNWQSRHLIVCDIISWPLVTSVANLGTQDGARSFGVLYCRQYILGYCFLTDSQSIGWTVSVQCHQDLVWHLCLLWEICWALMTDRFVCTKNHSIFIFSRNLLRIRSCDWFLPVILLEYDDSLYRILVKSWLYWYNRKLLSLYFRMPHRRVLNKQSKFACYVSSPQQCALRKIESSNRRMREVELKSTTIEQNKIFSSRRLLYCTGLGNDIFTLQMQPIQNTGDWNTWLHPWSYT